MKPQSDCFRNCKVRAAHRGDTDGRASWKILLQDEGSRLALGVKGSARPSRCPLVCLYAQCSTRLCTCLAIRCWTWSCSASPPLWPWGIYKAMAVATVRCASQFVLRTRTPITMPAVALLSRPWVPPSSVLSRDLRWHGSPGGGRGQLGHLSHSCAAWQVNHGRARSSPAGGRRRLGRLQDDVASSSASHKFASTDGSQVCCYCGAQRHPHPHALVAQSRPS